MSSLTTGSMGSWGGVGPEAKDKQNIKVSVSNLTQILPNGK